MTGDRSHGVVCVIAALLVGGCGGSGEQERSFETADAVRLASVSPVTPGWTWPADPEKPSSSSPPADVDATDPLLTALKQQTADLEDVAEEGSQWRDEEKLGNLVAQVYATASDARTGMAALNSFSRGWGKKTGVVTKDEAIDGLGDEAWVLWVGGSGTQVTYHWRRSNLVLEAHVHCFGSCTGNVDAATRAWVDAIDDEARAPG